MAGVDYLVCLFVQDRLGSDLYCMAESWKDRNDPLHLSCWEGYLQRFSRSGRIYEGQCSTQELSTAGKHSYPGSQEGRGKMVTRTWKKTVDEAALIKNRALVEGHDQPGRRNLDYKHSELHLSKTNTHLMLVTPNSWIQSRMQITVLTQSSWNSFPERECGSGRTNGKKKKKRHTRFMKSVSQRWSPKLTSPASLAARTWSCGPAFQSDVFRCDFHGAERGWPGMRSDIVASRGTSGSCLCGGVLSIVSGARCPGLV